MATGGPLGSGSGGGSLGDSVLGSLLALDGAGVSDLPVGEGGYRKSVDCLAPEGTVLGFLAKVHEVVMVREGCDAEVLETVFCSEALQVLAQDLVKEFFPPANPGSFLDWMAVTITACKELEHDFVGGKVWIAAVDVPEQFPAGLEELDRDGEGLGKVVEVLAGDSDWVIEA